jgi:hypothetical protein
LPDRFVELRARQWFGFRERVKRALELPLDTAIVFRNNAAHTINDRYPMKLASAVVAFMEERPLLENLAPTDNVVGIGIAIAAHA